VGIEKKSYHIEKKEIDLLGNARIIAGPIIKASSYEDAERICAEKYPEYELIGELVYSQEINEN
jgi:hypothetical protein